MPRSSSALILMRGKKSTLAAAPVGMRALFLPSTTDHGLADNQFSNTAKASTSLSAVLAGVPPPRCERSIPNQGGGHSSTPVFQHKI